MTPFTIHTTETAPETSRAALAAIRQQYGFLPKLHAVLAESPVALQALDSLFELVGKGTLTPQEQQVAMLTVSAFNRCAYCMAGHTYVARSVQLEEDALQALRDDQPMGGHPRYRALRSFTKAVLNQQGFAGGQPLSDFIQAGFSREAALEVLVIVAAKTLANFTNNLADTPAEDFMADPALHWVAPDAPPRPAD